MKNIFVFLFISLIFASNLHADSPFFVNKDKNIELEEELRRDFDDMDEAFIQLVDTYNTLFNRVWNNKKFTPQEKLSSYGTKGAFVLQVSVALRKFIFAIDPSYKFKPIPCSLIIENDGTINIAEGTCK